MGEEPRSFAGGQVGRSKQGMSGSQNACESPSIERGAALAVTPLAFQGRITSPPETSSDQFDAGVERLVWSRFWLISSWKEKQVHQLGIIRVARF